MLRHYKPSFSESKTLSLMRAEVGTHFDPDVYAAFEAVHDGLQNIKSMFDDEAVLDHFLEQNKA